ncbi:Nramp family divalent metal transporter [Marinicella rhabdoformis]|uniref:Nramp family divalent metal transporter n=1 Tax=Marinicella rhabdoformis TaxID=2580566 RepID=UPI0012AECE0B|nr:Nramp family divalent metal transporter [Marinicella rhabdoformis]
MPQTIVNPNEPSHNTPSTKASSLGPATWVAAAFIGPGTVTACTLAGAKFGFTLLWALLFSVLACMALQEMAARLGVVTKKGLSENIADQLKNPTARYAAFALIALAIFIGNSAYEGGNIAGAVLGISTLWPDLDIPWPMVIGAIAAPVIALGQNKTITYVMTALVILMSVAFVGTFVMVDVDMSAFFKGFEPSMPEGALLTVVALIGTTVVPYNLFLHATAAKDQWKDSDSPEVALSQARKDIVISIGVGGLISMAIIGTAAAAFFQQQIQIQNAADMAVQLTPLFGEQAKYLMALGLFAAGVSSAITAPLAARYAIVGMWPNAPKMFCESVAFVVLFSGLGLSLSGYKPITIIWFAQIANGILLPLMAVFLLSLMNNSQILGRFKNSHWHNAAGAVVVLVTLILSTKSLMAAFS